MSASIRVRKAKSTHARTYTALPLTRAHPLGLLGANISVCHVESLQEEVSSVAAFTLRRPINSLSLPAEGRRALLPNCYLRKEHQ